MKLSQCTAAVVAAGLMLFAAPMSFASTGLGRHKKMYAVPAPGKVTIDGKLDDWDLSAQIETYVESETEDMQSAKFALMYDRNNLYLSAVVRDPTPMMNRHDPAADGDKGWNADACQFRISIDPKLAYPLSFATYTAEGKDNPAVEHLTLWYYTDKQEPALQIHKSMMYQPLRPEWAPFGVVPANLFQAKYVRAADGRGYTFEYAIPWSTLGVKAPLTGGDIVAGTVQFNYSDPTGLKTAGNSAWCDDVLSQPGFPFQNTSVWGKIIFSAKGNLPKDMIEEGLAPTLNLPLKFRYDLPEDSQITIQLMDQNNVVQRILVPQGNRSAGTNVELWDGLDWQGRSLPAGNYTWKGIYHQPLTQKFLFSPHNAGQPPYQTDDGSGSWGGDHGNPNAVAAFDKGLLMSWGAAEVGSGLIRTDLTGRKQWGHLKPAEAMASDGKRIFSAYGPVTLSSLDDGRTLAFGNGNASLTPPPGGNDDNNDVAGVAYHDGIVYTSFHARNLIGLYDAGSGDLKSTVDVSLPGFLTARPDGALLAVSAGQVVVVQDGKVAPFIDSHLDTPRGIAIGPDGLVYVANAGKLQNVSVFDAKGRYLRSIGIAGGRPAVGDYNPNGMLEPGGIAVDSNNHLWVAEKLDFPKRIGEWDAGTGAFVKDFFGACSYFGYAYIDPRKPDEIYCHNVLWKIDWNNNTCSPVSTTWRNTAPNMMHPPGPQGYNHHPVYFTAKNGHQYSYGNDNFMSMVSYREDNLYKPMAAVIQIARGNVFYGNTVQFPIFADAAKYPNGIYFWQDHNNDQTIQDDELTLLPAGVPANLFLDDDLNVYLGNYRVTPTHIAENGQAVYDVTQRVKTAVGRPDEADGSAYTYRIDDYVGRYAADGTRQWGFPGGASWQNSLAKPLQAPGTLWGLTNFLGVAGNVVGWADYFGPYHVFTRDGIYVGMLMRDLRRGGGLGPDVTATEVATGQLVQPDGMNGRTFLIAGASDARVTEVFGFDTIKPLAGGTLTLTTADVKLAADALADYNAKLSHGKQLSIARGAQGLDTAEPIECAVDETRSFKVRAAYDADNLYLAYDVESPTDLVSAAPDPQLLFKGGNVLDIQIGADATADAKRTAAVPGDVRMLVTRRDDKPVVVLYRPKIEGFAGTPIVLTSPTGKEPFDSIETTDRVGVTYRKTPAGYTALVTIPQNLVGLNLAPGRLLRMDLGVIYGNETGNKVSTRSYWSNNGPDAHITNDVPTESRLDPQEWGTASVE